MNNGSNDLYNNNNNVNHNCHLYQQQQQPILPSTLLQMRNSSDESSITTNQQASTTKRTRITRACDTCRRKKIKCDVDTNRPCTTCKQYDWECTFNDTAKKRGPPKGYIESLETRLEKMEQLLKNIGSGNDHLMNDIDTEALFKKRKRRQTSTSSSSTSTTSMVDQNSPNMTVDNNFQKRGKVVRYHGSSSGFYLMGNILSDSHDKLHEAQKDSTGSIENDQQRKVYIIPSINGNQQYRFRRMNMDDDDFMVVRDATADEEAVQEADDGQEMIDNIIPRSLLVFLVNSYFKDAHATLPILDKDEYMDAFEGRTTPPPAPLLTYAICTYTCFLLKTDDPVFKEAGIERDVVFQTLLDRATLLVRKEYLNPRIVTIQALVLLCGHPTYSTSSYRNWILAGMAVRMAQDLGLHRTLTTVEVCNEFRERRKKLWYSVYVTDRWCCAVMGRPLAIADSDCDVDLPLLTINNTGEDLTMFVNFVKLSGILGEVLRRIYSPKAKINGYKTKAMEQTVWSLQKMLQEWFSNVPDGYKMTEQDLNDMKIHPERYPIDSKKIMEGGPLTVCYYAVVLLLHRPFILFDNDEVTMPSLASATELCKRAAKMSVDIARAIPYMAIAKFGWNFAAYSVFQAALIHVYNCTSTDPETAKEAKEYFRICQEECLAPLSKDIPAGPPLIPFLQTLCSLLQPNENSNTVQKETNDPSSSTQQQQPMSQEQRQASAYRQTTVPSEQHTMNDSQTVNSSNGFINAILSDNSNQSWLLNGHQANGGATSLSQAAWQQLFSTAGTPFTDNASNRGFEAQGWDNFFMENQSNNVFMP
ncbi:MAG: fungal-specific transcription factor domain-containing protein [Benjaminiella poitrasii]|nr:MAG: fungal-specific transcription factor domain-containing protein [Benjaminiella poitrasii]